MKVFEVVEYNISKYCVLHDVEIERQDV
jgi:hypothetical protein